MDGLEGRRVIVLGASSGIGRSLVGAVLAGGAEVLACARRADLLADVVAAAGRGSTCVIDVSDPDQLSSLTRAAEDLGPIDAVVSTVGLSPLKPLLQTGADDWSAILRTNVIGINSAVRAVHPFLKPGGVVLALSSETVADPRWGLGAYGASKAALEASFASWRLECPEVRFGTVVVGATVPTDFAREFDMDLLPGALEIWVRHGQAQDQFMDTDELGQVIAGLLAAVLPFPGINLERMILRSPSAVTGSADLMKRVALD